MRGNWFRRGSKKNLAKKMLRAGILSFGVCFSQQESHAEGTPQPELQGKKIHSVHIEILPIFPEQNLNWVYRTANNLKIGTKESVIQRELLIKAGEKYDEFRVRESERQLRDQRFLNPVVIQGKLTNNDEVDLVVKVQETWTLIPQLGYSSSSNGGNTNYSFGIAETDFLGYGKRIEVLQRESDNRTSTEAVWDDRRAFGTLNRFVAGYFDREDGERQTLLYEHPFRSMRDKYAWVFDAENANVVGRLFELGDEEYIYRRKVRSFEGKYVWSNGNYKSVVKRFSLGFSVLDESFSQADLEDYEALSLDPTKVSNDPSRVPEDRKFHGLTIGYQSIVPDFISLNYIDRFERVEDFNLGDEGSVNLMYAPEALGSEGNTLHFSGNRSRGFRFSDKEFIRMEGGVMTRFGASKFLNTLIRGETKYYKVLGAWYAGDRFLGRHTLASQLAVDIGYNLDGDREFLLGSDSGLRGYEQRAFSGSKRIAFSVEDRVHLIEQLFHLVSIGGAVFFDAGAASDDTLVNVVGRRMYSNVGVGLRLGFPRSSGGGVMRFDIAVPLRDGPEDSGRFEPRFVISSGQPFSARSRSEILGPEKANIEVGFDR